VAVVEHRERLCVARGEQVLVGPGVVAAHVAAIIAPER
jgi:hypothetical protein